MQQYYTYTTYSLFECQLSAVTESLLHERRVNDTDGGTLLCYILLYSMNHCLL